MSLPYYFQFSDYRGILIYSNLFVIATVNILLFRDMCVGTNGFFFNSVSVLMLINQNRENILLVSSVRLVFTYTAFVIPERLYRVSNRPFILDSR